MSGHSAESDAGYGDADRDPCLPDLLAQARRLMPAPACPNCGLSDAYHGVIVEAGEPLRWACDECGHVEVTADLCGYSRDGLVCIHARGHGVPDGENIGRHHLVTSRTSVTPPGSGRES